MLGGKLLATIELEDATIRKLSTNEEKVNYLNEKVYNELILSCCENFSLGVEKIAKRNYLPKRDVKEACSKLKTRYESNTGTELLTLHKEYMSLEMTDVNEDSEISFTELDKICARVKEDLFNEEILDNNRFMIHILNSVPV